MQNYDVLVIGSGPAGFSAAIGCSRFGKSVALIERDSPGGVYINKGAIPTKSLLRNAEISLLLRHRTHEFGFESENLHLDFGIAVTRSKEIARRLSSNLGKTILDLKITYLQGSARMLSTKILRVTDQKGIFFDVEARDVVIATGADPLHVPGIEPDGQQIITYREAVEQANLPQRALILGGGALGVEMASIWNAYGVDVIIVENAPRLVPYEDEEISDALAEEFLQKGMHIYTGTTIQSINKKSDQIEVSLSSKHQTQTLFVDQILEAVSFKHNSDGLGLKETGIAIGENGVIQADEQMKSSIPGIWAVGDVNGKLMLAASAAAMGNTCAAAICGHAPPPINFEMLPKVTYCLPQIASFGMTERQAIERGYRIKIYKSKMDVNGMALALGEETGLIKLITEEQSGIILGSHLIGQNVSELLPELVFARSYGHPADDVLKCIHARPTLGAILTDTLSGFHQ